MYQFERLFFSGTCMKHCYAPDNTGIVLSDFATNAAICPILSTLSYWQCRLPAPELSVDFSPRSRWVWLSKNNIAIRDESQCRIRLVYVLTSKAPSPHSCLALSNHFSICHLENATVNNFLRQTLAGALLTKYFISPVLRLFATINQYCRSVGLEIPVPFLFLLSVKCTRPLLICQTALPRVVSLISSRFHCCLWNIGL